MARSITVPPWLTSAGSPALAPSHTTTPPPGQAPLRQWYDSRTGLAPPCSQVRLPSFVKLRFGLTLAPALIVAGVSCPSQVTA